LLGFMTLLAAGCSSPVSTDAGRDGATDGARDVADGSSDVRIDTGPTVCTHDSDCADGVFCNGAERCAPGMPGANAMGCVAASPAAACAADSTCDEAGRRCVGCSTDADHDGHVSVSCGGDDCNDALPGLNPGAMEQCDTAMVDDNCDGAANEGCSCVDGTTVPCGSMLPGCTSGVQTCAGGMLGACSVTVTLIACYADGDGDGYAAAGAAMSMACACPGGTTSTAPAGASTTDCNDTRADVHPGAPEQCDAARVDENCSGAANEACACVNGTTMPCGSSLPGCAMGVRTCVMGMLGTCSVTNVIGTCYADSDMDLYAPAGAATSMACVCPAGTTNRTPSGATTTDCNDSRNNVHPGATETCDGIDNNCNGTIDDGLRINCYTDADNDTFPATGAAASLQCPDNTRTRFGNCPAGYTNVAPAAATTDCNDGQALTPHCGAPMHCTPERVCGCEASLWNNADYLDLETGAVTRGTPSGDIWDYNGSFAMQYISFRTGVSFRHLDPATFVSIDASYATALMTAAMDPSPFVSTTVIVVRTGSGNVFKLGNPSIVTYMGAQAIHFTYAPISATPAGFACMM
jgi:hypothetical protein